MHRRTDQIVEAIARFGNIGLGTIYDVISKIALAAVIVILIAGPTLIGAATSDVEPGEIPRVLIAGFATSVIFVGIIATHFEEILYMPPPGTPLQRGVDSYRALWETVDAVAKKLAVPPFTDIYLARDAALETRYYRGKKELIVGVVLLHLLERGEISALLAHEYAHYSNDAMRSYEIHQRNVHVSRAIDTVASRAESVARKDKFRIFVPIVVPLFAMALSLLVSVLVKLMGVFLVSAMREQEFRCDAVAAKSYGGVVMSIALKKAVDAGAALRLANVYVETLGEEFSIANLKHKDLVARLFQEIGEVPLGCNRSLYHTLTPTHPTIDARCTRLRVSQAAEVGETTPPELLTTNEWRELVAALTSMTIAGGKEVNIPTENDAP